ncbi:MAG: amidohydrolase family protein [Pyrinomonadaceae bacterium]|nr:amidohydrolase family protein [Blastocatellia bacterium]MCW5955014.1 amidohydrolase family protein [Pyrinomonadaceae bacterium]
MQKIIASVLIVLTLSLIIAAQAPKVTVIKAGRLIDTVNGKVLENQTIIIEGDRIKAVGSNLTVPSGAEVIDLSKMTVMPGFSDSHVHITGQAGGDYYETLFRRNVMDEAVSAHIYAKRTLDAGFTTVRSLGTGPFVDIALRNAINRGEIPGPRILAANMYIGSTGSHGDLTGFSPWLGDRTPPEMSGVADGVEEVRKKVRYLIKYGADVIKFGATAGVLTEEASVGAPQYSQEEMNAIVAEAHLHGIKVTAHAHGAEGIKMAIRAGVDSIEHGSFLDDEGIRMMKERGTYLSADIYNDDYILAEYAKFNTPQVIIDKEKLVGRVQRENFKKAVQAGVKIAYGTDAGVYPHGWNGKQFAKMVEWGMTPMGAIQASTVSNADLFGWSDRIGSITAGKFADIVAVDGDPLQNISILEKVGFVMKGGVVYKGGTAK